MRLPVDVARSVLHQLVCDGRVDTERDADGCLVWFVPLARQKAREQAAAAPAMRAALTTPAAREATSVELARSAIASARSTKRSQR